MTIYSHIEWTEATWNPITGCTKISDGCKHCYAERLALRLKSMGNSRYKNGFELTAHPDLFDLPLKWKRSRVIFVNSMSDLFHENISSEIIKEIFYTMNRAKQHIFQILTKRSNRLIEMASQVHWTDNIWMGVTVENKRAIHRINDLKSIPARIKFISAEPLLEDLNGLSLNGINWLIVGGESGPYARPVKVSWIRNLRDQCIKREIPFFFKQWGGFNKRATGRTLDGRLWNEMPNHAITTPIQPHLFLN